MTLFGKYRQFLCGMAAGALLAGVSIAAYCQGKQTIKLPVEQVQKFAQTIEIVKHNYVENVSDKELFDHAIEGMLSTLDPHSAFLDKQDYKNLNVSTKGEFGGLGIEVTKKKGVIRVVSPIDDTPAKKAGIKAGDWIVKIDDKSVRGMKLSEAVKLMRGKKGSAVNLTIVRPDNPEPLTLHIVRDIIKVESVSSRILDKRYGYLRISVFQDDTPRHVKQALQKLEKESKGPLKGLIIDLRSNPGGVLSAAVKVSDLFLDARHADDNKKIVYTKGRIEDSEYTATMKTPDQTHGLPLVVLINSGSASASEIVAGALQDHGRAVVMGIQSFGKGSVQTVVPLKDGTALKLTTARYYTPEGRSIQAEGIKPDISVEQVEVPYDKKHMSDLDNWRIREADLQNTLENGDKPGAQPQSSEQQAPESSAQAAGSGSQQVDESSENKGSQSTREKDEVAETEVSRLNGKDQADKPLMYRDYQLSEALHVLKALSVQHRLSSQ